MNMNEYTKEIQHEFHQGECQRWNDYLDGIILQARPVALTKENIQDLTSSTGYMRTHTVALKTIPL